MCIAVCRVPATARSRRDFKLGFNSLGAHSSVNHFHFQGFCVRPLRDCDTMPVEDAAVVAVPGCGVDDGAAVVVQESLGYPSTFFRISARDAGGSPAVSGSRLVARRARDVVLCAC